MISLFDHRLVQSGTHPLFPRNTAIVEPVCIALSCQQPEAVSKHRLTSRNRSHSGGRWFWSNIIL